MIRERAKESWHLKERKREEEAENVPWHRRIMLWNAYKPCVCVCVCVCVCIWEDGVLYYTPIMTLNTSKSCNKYKRKLIQNGIRTHPCFHRIQIFAYAPFFYISFFFSYTFLIHTTLLITLERALSQLHTYTSNCMAKTLVKPVPVELIETEGIRVDWYNDSFIAPLNI